MDFIAKPFGMLLMALYELTRNYGAAILLFALAVKLVLLYFSAKSKKSIMRSTRFTPYLKELEAGGATLGVERPAPDDQISLTDVGADEVRRRLGDRCAPDEAARLMTEKLKDDSAPRTSYLVPR